MTTPLSDVVRTAFSQSKDIWFPETAKHLSDFAWQDAARLAFTPENYGTHRWLLGDSSVERLQLARLDFGNALSCLIERLPQQSRSLYEKSGLEFSDHFPADAIQQAVNLISSVPSLSTTLSLYLRSLHILEAPGAEYDVSHSDPAVPFSIFLSVPPAGQTGRLRLAESIIHECMHLQLSIVERALPLIDEPHAMYFSPWKQTSRPASGVLHGLYVFSVIYQFFGCSTLNAHLTSQERLFADLRRSQLSRELNQVVPFARIDSLSREGRCLAARSLDCLPLCR